MNGQGQRPPDGQARRSQLLLGSGPGALIDLVDDAVIVGGLEAWRYRRAQEGFIVEARLQNKAQAILSKMPWWSATDVRLRLPPECDNNQPTLAAGITVGRFPKWFQCMNSDCRSLIHMKALKRPGMREHECRRDKRNTSKVVPVRFVAACLGGHVQDIDWRWFVHRERRGEMKGSFRAWCDYKPGANRENDPLCDEWTADLYILQIGTSGDLADSIVGCRKCGMQRGLQDLAQKGILGACQGERPWLGSDATEPGCQLGAQLLTRTASNAYFPSPISVLSIPDPALALREAVERVWDFVKIATADFLPMIRQYPNVQPVLAPFSDAEILAEIKRRQLGLPVEDLPIRETEWRALMAAPAELPTDHPKPDERWHARHLSGGWPNFVDRVVLVKHLTEVRAQIGFTRIEPFSGDAEGEYELPEHTAPLGAADNWLPAAEILGEGVFIAFNPDRIDTWARRAAVHARGDAFRRGFVTLNATRVRPLIYPGERLVMLHTLSHLLITSISLECGYAASSIRERLYCAVTRDDAGNVTTARAGILLYTGSPGSEGTLGGLVEVGRNIVHHLRRAAQMAMLCSNDPVCAQHSPDDEQEGRYREGAACHGCVLIGEPSCERMNQDLDRSLVVPTVEMVDAAFLGDWIASWS